MRPASWITATCLALAAPACGPEPIATGAPPAEVALYVAGPAARDVAWGTLACWGCRMPVDFPHFAAQAQRPDGELLVFDDAGCLVIELAMGRLAEPLHLFFHHADEDRWVAQEAAGFVPRVGTPMDFGYVAVDAGGEALTFEAFAAVLRERFDLPR